MKQNLPEFNTAGPDAAGLTIIRASYSSKASANSIAASGHSPWEFSHEAPLLGIRRPCYIEILNGAKTKERENDLHSDRTLR